MSADYASRNPVWNLLCYHFLQDYSSAVQIAEDKVKVQIAVDKITADTIAGAISQFIYESYKQIKLNKYAREEKFSSSSVLVVG